MPNHSGIPTTGSINFFLSAINSHREVRSITKREGNIFVIDRARAGRVVVYLTDIYTIGIADVVEAMASTPDINCIVTVSNWNGYTKIAKQHAEENEIGVFLVGEFMGALNRDDFWKYVKRDDKGNPIYHFHA